MPRSSILLVATLTLAAGAELGTAKTDKQPNVLIILADDLGVDFVGAYGEGSDPAPTPTIDGLAANGVLFRNAWANPSCSPTRACIMSGRYPFRTTVGRWIDYPKNSNTVGTLSPLEVTIPEVLDLDGGGYAHGYIGKWHMSYQYQGLGVPNAAGWSWFAGKMKGMGSSNYYDWPRVVNGVQIQCKVYATTQQVDDAVAWIQAQSQPWVCYLSFLAPHLPMHEPPAHLHTQSLTGVPATTTSRPHYKAVIEAMDTELGRLFQTLGPQVMASTNVVFLGDNGSVQNMAAPPFLGGRAKGSPYEGGLNVPLIFSGPAVVNPGREVTDLACAVDVFDTVLDLAGASNAIPPWAETDGVSLLPYITDTAKAPARTCAYAEEFTGTVWPAPLSNGHATIRNGRYKLIRRMTKADELYDLLADPFEQTNLLTGTMTAIEQQNHTDLVNQIAALRANTATVTPYGASTCVSSNGKVPGIHQIGSPRLGYPFGVQASGGLPGGTAFHVLGLDAVRWSGLQLPLDLATSGNCRLLASPLVMTALPINGSGDAYLVGTVPVNESLVGLRTFHQWLLLDPAAPNGAGLVTTSAMAGRIGL